MAIIKLAIFDVAGTTAQDGGTVLKAFQIAMTKIGFKEDSYEYVNGSKHVQATMGQRKIDVFRHILGGNEMLAQDAHSIFVDSYIQLVQSGEITEFPGVSEMFSELNKHGIGVALTTGFPEAILKSVIKNLDWENLINVHVASDQVNAGRPSPDLNMKCLSLYNSKYVTQILPQEVAVVGDTDSDMKAGLAMGANLIIGVTSGSMSEEVLVASGATNILPFATDLLTLVNY